MWTPHFSPLPCGPLTLLHSHVNPPLYCTAMWTPHFTAQPCEPPTLLHSHVNPPLYCTAMWIPHSTPLVTYNLPRSNMCIKSPSTISPAGTDDNMVFSSSKKNILLLPASSSSWSTARHYVQLIPRSPTQL